MKFGEQIKVLTIPEWSRMYVDYEDGKNLIYTLREDLEEYHTLIEAHHITLSQYEVDPKRPGTGSSSLGFMCPRRIRGTFRFSREKSQPPSYYSVEMPVVEETTRNFGENSPLPPSSKFTSSHPSHFTEKRPRSLSKLHAMSIEHLPELDYSLFPGSAHPVHTPASSELPHLPSPPPEELPHPPFVEIDPGNPRNGHPPKWESALPPTPSTVLHLGLQHSLEEPTTLEPRPQSSETSESPSVTVTVPPSPGALLPTKASQKEVKISSSASSAVSSSASSAVSSSPFSVSENTRRLAPVSSPPGWVPPAGESSPLIDMEVLPFYPAERGSARGGGYETPGETRAPLATTPIRRSLSKLRPPAQAVLLPPSATGEGEKEEQELEEKPGVVFSALVGTPQGSEGMESPGVVQREAPPRQGVLVSPFLRASGVQKMSEISWILHRVAHLYRSMNQEMGNWILRECRKVNRFYMSRAQFIANRAALLLDRAKMVATMSSLEKQRLRQGMEEAYFALDLLRSYCTVNSIAFCKILKKFDKNTLQNCREDVTQYLSSRWFFQTTHSIDSSPNRRLKDLLVKVYADLFCQGSMKTARTFLHVKKHDERQKESRSPLFLTGFFSGATLAIFVLLLFEYCSHYSEISSLSEASVSRSQFIFSLGYVGTFLLLSFALVVLIWESYGINYAFILELDLRKHFTAFGLMCLAFLQLLIGVTCAYGFLHSALFTEGYSLTPNAPTYAYLFAALSVLLTFLFHLRHRFSSHWLWHHLLRAFAAPWYRVRFADFFLMDYLCSMTDVLGELPTALCVWEHPSSATNAFCLGYRTWRIPLLPALPHMLRLLQCLRRYRDQEGDSLHPNLTNAMKYAAGLLQLVLGFVLLVCKRMFGMQSVAFAVMEGVWLFAAFSDASYKLLWDYHMDWGLLSFFRNRGSRDPLLREQLWYPRWAYFSSAAVNAVLRFLWLIRHIFFPNWGRSLLFSGWGWILWVSLELTRRAMWAVLRLENEQLNNFENYRAVNITPPDAISSSSSSPSCAENANSDMHAPIDLILRETDKEIQRRMEGSQGPEKNTTNSGTRSSSSPLSSSAATDLFYLIPNVKLKYQTKLTSFFAHLPEHAKVRVLQYQYPGQSFALRKDTGKTIRFATMHEEDKVCALYHLLGGLTIEQYCRSHGLLHWLRPSRPEKRSHSSVRRSKSVPRPSPKT